jgi:hypothetical protein
MSKMLQGGASVQEDISDNFSDASPEETVQECMCKDPLNALGKWYLDNFTVHEHLPEDKFGKLKPLDAAIGTVKKPIDDYNSVTLPPTSNPYLLQADATAAPAVEGLNSPAGRAALDIGSKAFALRAALSKPGSGTTGGPATKGNPTAGAGPRQVRQPSRVATPKEQKSLDSLVDRAKKTASKTTKQIVGTYERPSGFRAGVREKAWENAKGLDGKVRDPLTKQEMKFEDPWEMGHKPGYEFRKHQQSAANRGISRKQFLDEHNNPDHYVPELKSSNGSHAGELKTDEYFGD